MRRRLVVCMLALAITALMGRHSRAEDDEPPLLVGVKPAPPFVMVDESSGVVSGFSIDLSRLIAAQLNPPRQVKFQVHESLEEHLNTVRSGQVDFGIAATSFSSERQRTLDFSLPFYQSGLDIAVRPEGGGVKVWEILTSRELIGTFVWLTIFLVVCAHVIWLTDGIKSDTFDDSWLAGIGQTLWWTIVTMTTVGYGDFVPRKPLGRLLSVLIILVGIMLFGMVVGTFSSAITLQKIASDIQGPDDLRGESVSVVRNTIAEQVMRRRGADVMVVESLEEALVAVETKKTVAAVHDFPQLRHHLSRDAHGLVLVGRLFSIKGYGITYPVGSNLRKKINVALLELTEGDPSLYRQLSERWFGVQ